MKIDDNSSAKNQIITAVKRAQTASCELATTKGSLRSQGVQILAQEIENAFDEILEANTLDLETSREMAVPELILEWLKLTPERLQNTVQILKRIGELSDPIQRVMNAPYQLDPAQTYCQLMPLGVIAFIYEAFPELAAIAAGLCLKTGNSLILRGGSEASHCNAAIAKVMKNALEDAKLPSGSLEILSSDLSSAISELVVQDQYINLVIPYGRDSLVKQVTQRATAPVLRSAMGNCYLYWSPSGELDLARWVILDSHASEPDPVNALEKVIIHRNQKSSTLVRLFKSLEEKGFELHGDPELAQEFPDQLKLVEESEWDRAYLKKIVSFKVVDNIEAAIAWMNQYSSGHANCLVTESYAESRQFAQEIDSALVYINSSPRFYRNSKRGDSVFLGMSNQKGHRRGLIGLETFTTLKQVVQGERRN
ncbi:MAG: glutamate-5-semialdehyde dehydrogenase [Oscillatoria sp. PMC 1051.18]|nr:glutamate-5-semialdehyde dehydrogenase [Oscillatoria sp. PMC 1050.18]MEC5030595.1 glutamate-5-semialdehyde dehydrogenase [Oscillatoria sp. PMC 1051.18]